MDRNRFDTLARLLGTAGSRRTALGSVLGAVLLGTAADPASGKNGNKKRRRRRQRNQTTCFGTKSCDFPRDGNDFQECRFAAAALDECNGCNFRRADLAGADLENGRFQGASFRDANLAGAILEGADLSGVSFRGACLTGASLFGADTNGAHFDGAILCGTILPDGQTDNSGCGRTTACCPSNTSECTSDAGCGGSQPFCCNDVCSELCCSDAQCPGEETCDQGVCQIPNPTCAADPDACTDGFIQCGGGGGSSVCYCYVTAEGDSRCLNINQSTNPFCAGTPCNTSADCGSGQFCAALHGPTTCCTAKICGSECPEFDVRTRAEGEGVGPPRP